MPTGVIILHPPIHCVGGADLDHMKKEFLRQRVVRHLNLMAMNVKYMWRPRVANTLVDEIEIGPHFRKSWKDFQDYFMRFNDMALPGGANGAIVRSAKVL